MDALDGLQDLLAESQSRGDGEGAACHGSAQIRQISPLETERESLMMPSHLLSAGKGNAGLVDILPGVPSPRS